jgi:hypothetical protein
MQYMILFNETARDFALRSDPARAPAHMGAWAAYIDAMAKAGIIVHGNGLMPPETGTIVRVRNGVRSLQDGAVQDGPYADSKEQVGGYFIVEVPDLDTALEWAARSPSASYASTEVRPVMPPMPQ